MKVEAEKVAFGLHYTGLGHSRYSFDHLDVKFAVTLPFRQRDIPRDIVEVTVELFVR